MPTRHPMEEQPRRTEPEDEDEASRETREREEERRQSVRDDEHDGGFGDGPL